MPCACQLFNPFCDGYLINEKTEYQNIRFMCDSAMLLYKEEMGTGAGVGAGILNRRKINNLMVRGRSVVIQGDISKITKLWLKKNKEKESDGYSLQKRIIGNNKIRTEYVAVQLRDITNIDLDTNVFCLIFSSEVIEPRINSIKSAIANIEDLKIINDSIYNFDFYFARYNNKSNQTNVKSICATIV